MTITSGTSVRRLDDAALIDCDVEPIRTPGGIQPQGALLVVEEHDLRVRHASDNVEALSRAAHARRARSLPSRARAWPGRPRRARVARRQRDRSALAGAACRWPCRRRVRPPERRPGDRRARGGRRWGARDLRRVPGRRPRHARALPARRRRARGAGGGDLGRARAHRLRPRARVPLRARWPRHRRERAASRWPRVAARPALSGLGHSGAGPGALPRAVGSCDSRLGGSRGRPGLGGGSRAVRARSI